MTLMKVTIVGYYTADLEHYDGETDPNEMAAIDQGNVENDPIWAVTLCDDGITTTVEPVDA